ncbi:MAG: carbohydrate ABC transporter permease [Christensenellales bacterium]|jgi:putative aldouronate transport system permease protein
MIKASAKTKSVIRDTMADRVFLTINIIIMSLFLLVFLYPLLYIISASFSSGSALLSGRVYLWPVGFNLEGYKAVFNYRLILVGFRNSFFYMIVGTAISLAMTVLAAYPLSRGDLVFKKGVLFFFSFTMFFSGGLIPSFLLVRDLGMRNTVWAILIPGAMSVWNMLVTRSYFSTSIPGELLEAAQIDGCNDFTFFGKVVIPLSAPIIAVMALFYAVGRWNSYFSALIYLDNINLYPLQLFLRQVLLMNTIDFSMMPVIDLEDAANRLNLTELLKYALIVVSSLPVLLIYPFVQKYFVKGVMLGSLKG